MAVKRTINPNVHPSIDNGRMNPEPVTLTVLPVTDAPATRQAPVVLWTDLIANWHAKRAIEVAWAGGHSIRFLGTPNAQAQELAIYARSKGIDAVTVQACPCGHYGDPKRECTCTLEMVTDWQAQYNQFADIVIELADLKAADIVSHLTHKFSGESEATVQSRVDNAPKYTDPALDDAAHRLLEMAVRQMDLTPERVKSALSVARTIANLSNDRTIAAQHIAEAIQYQR